jgi:hypothetical protein
MSGYRNASWMPWSESVNKWTAQVDRDVPSSLLCPPAPRPDHRLGEALRQSNIRECIRHLPLIQMDGLVAQALRDLPVHLLRVRGLRLPNHFVRNSPARHSDLPTRLIPPNVSLQTAGRSPYSHHQCSSGLCQMIPNGRHHTITKCK